LSDENVLDEKRHVKDVGAYVIYNLFSLFELLTVSF